MKRRKSQGLSKSTPTLTQSGLLAVLLQRQHDKAIELAQRRAHRGGIRSAFSTGFTWLLARARAADSERGFGRVVYKPGAMFHQIHSYTDLRQQIHQDLRLQHPDWVQPNGESPICDVYEARLMQLKNLSSNKRPLHHYQVRSFCRSLKQRSEFAMDRNLLYTFYRRE